MQPDHWLHGEYKQGTGGLGVGFGVGLGVGFGVGLGVAFGVGFGAVVVWATESIIFDNTIKYKIFTK